MNGLNVHHSDWAQQPDVHIQCSDKWTIPAWKDHDPSLPEGVHEGDGMVFYTFREELVTCVECKAAMAIDPEVEKEFNTFWKDIVCRPDGSIRKYQIMKELYDYGRLIENSTKIICEITDGMVSKPLTDPDVVLGIAEDKEQGRYEQNLQYEREAWETEGMEVIKIKVKKLNPNAIVPKYQTEFAAGVDVHAAFPHIESKVLWPGATVLVPTGLALEIPPGYEVQVRPRSGLAAKQGITVLNSPGTIDADYRGEIGVILINHGSDTFTIRNGERVAQLVVAKVAGAEFVVSEDLNETKRGEGGFGSTGT